MKQSLILLLLFFSISKGFSQDYMDKIVEKSCDCVNKIPDSLETEKKTLQLGLCLIEAALPYSKQIKKDHKIDLEKLDEHGEQLGQIIALRMMGVCPDALIMISEAASANTPKEEEGEKSIEGTISRIEDDYFVTYHVKDNAGKITKFYWLTFIESNRDMITQYKSLTGKKVTIIYKNMEFFDPKIGEYRSYQVISKIEVVNN